MSIKREDLLWIDRSGDGYPSWGPKPVSDADLAALGYVRLTSRLLDGLVGAMMSQVNYEGARRAFQKQLEFALSEQALDGEET